MIVKLILENFKRYRGKHEIIFKPGLNLIQGHNDAGKSSLFHAISYVFFNQTPTLGTTTYALVTHGEQSMRVVLEFIAPKTGELYRLVRGRSSARSSASFFTLMKYDNRRREWLPLLSSSRGGRERELRIKLSEILGFDKKVFFNVIYAPQKEFVNIVRGGSEVKRILDSILGISAISTLKQCVHETIRDVKVKVQGMIDIESRLREYESFERSFKERLNTLAESIMRDEVSYRQLMKQLKFHEERHKLLEGLLSRVNKVKELRNRVKQLEAAIEQISGDISKLCQKWGDVASVRRMLLECQNNLKAIEEDLRKVEKEIDSLRARREEVLKRIGYLESTIKSRLQVSTKSRCPLCGQPIDRELIESEIRMLDRERHQLKLTIEKLDVRARSLEEKRTSLMEKREKLLTKTRELEMVLDQMDELIKRIDEIKREKSSLSNTVTSEVRDIASALAKIADEQELLSRLGDLDQIEVILNSLYKKAWKLMADTKSQLSAIRSRIESMVKERKEIMKQLEKVQANINRLRRELQTIKKYEKALEELERLEKGLEVLEEEFRRRVLTLLAERTYYWYRQLVSEPLYTRVVIDPETYEVLAQPIGFNEPQPVRSFSGGGHETLFALAFRLALAETTGVRDFLMFDEPTDATDSRNRDSLIEALHRASHNFNQILLITHHGIGREISAHIINIKYDRERNSSIVETA